MKIMSLSSYLSDQVGCISAQIEQHVAGLTLSVIGQQLQKLWAWLVSFGYFRLWSLNLVGGDRTLNVIRVKDFSRL